ncbi:hypothetical protein KIN34_00620 [Cellulomonas sp. DKR-3]|uniref:Co/Zn/Cd efflux system component n=1 Tax=Cellulomonas fulva TaxID=2835530 RepID=A0ABS5TUH6_9CELL|nr:hypothetical protein [Cellulomonas fulva]
MLGVTAFVLLLGLAAGGVLLALQRLSPPAPVTQRCEATVDGSTYALGPDQAQNAALFAGQAARRGLPARAVTIAIATALQESRLENIDYGDRDSIGLFQQRPSQGWGSVEEIMDPVYATGRFFDGLVEVDGYEDMAVTDAAQAVQRSAFPEAYAQHEQRARAWASALTGFSPAAVTCTLREPEAPGALDAAVARVARDLGDVAVDPRAARDDEPARLVVHAEDRGDAPARQAWAVSAWAVATASVLGTTRVEVADRVWERSTGAWTTDPEGRALPTGRVRITL